MFSLIISIIAIALVAALALASIYYGGSAFQKGAAEAEASTLINQGQQIQGAVALQAVESETRAANLAALVGDYLKESPRFNGNEWAVVEKTGAGTVDSGDFITQTITVTSGETGDLCEAVMMKAGDTASDSYTAPATEGDAVAINPTFGCYAATTTNTIYYKL